MSQAALLPNEAERNPIVFARDGEAFADSRDIAAYFGKRHDGVIRDIRNLIAKRSDLGLHNFVEFKINDLTGEHTSHYEMDRLGFSVLALGFTGEKALDWKIKYVRAFDAMEEEIRRRKEVNPMAALNDPATLRGLLLTYTEKVQTLEAKAAELQPKADALARIAEADGSLCVTDAAKTLQIPPKALFRYLRAHGWIYTRPGCASDVAYQSKLANGLLEHKTNTKVRPDGTERVFTQVRVTPKGLTKLAEVFPPVAALV